MNLQRFASRVLALCVNVRPCQDGTMQGAALALSENSTNTAWLELNGRVGRYVFDDKVGKLVWQPREGA